MFGTLLNSTWIDLMARMFGSIPRSMLYFTPIVVAQYLDIKLKKYSLDIKLNKYSLGDVWAKTVLRCKVNILSRPISMHYNFG